MWAHKRQQHPEILRNRTAAPVPCALLSMCCFPFLSSLPPLLPAPCPLLCTPFAQHNPLPLAIWAFLNWGCRIGHKTQPLLAGPMPVPVFDVISMWQWLCLLVGPALVACALWHYFNNEATVRPRSHSSLAPDPRFSYSFFLLCCSWTKHAEWHEPQLRLPLPLPLPVPCPLPAPPPPSTGHKLISWRINWLTDIRRIPPLPRCHSQRQSRRAGQPQPRWINWLQLDHVPPYSSYLWTNISLYFKYHKYIRFYNCISEQSIIKIYWTFNANFFLQ